MGHLRCGCGVQEEKMSSFHYSCQSDRCGTYIGWRPLTCNEMISLAVWLIACRSSGHLLPHRDMRWAPEGSQYALGTWKKCPVSLGHDHEFIVIVILLCRNKQTPSLEWWHGSLSSGRKLVHRPSLSLWPMSWWLTVLFCILLLWMLCLGTHLIWALFWFKRRREHMHV